MAHKIIITAWDLTIANSETKRASKQTNSLTTVKAVMDDVKSHKPQNVMDGNFIAIEILEGGNTIYRTGQAASTYTISSSILDEAKLTALFNEVQNPIQSK